jgi:hypothetical protein
VVSDSFVDVQALSPLGQHQITLRPLRQVPRVTRQRVGLAIAALSLGGLAIGGAQSTRAADAQAVRIADQTPTGASESGLRQSAPTQRDTPPDPSAPAEPVPGSSVPGSSVPGSSVPGSSVPGSSVPNSEWTLMVVGDSLLTRKIGEGVNPFDRARPSLRSADLSIVNVETAISDATTKEPKQFNFKSPVKFAELMRDAGVDVGSLANNHSLDFGDQGMIDTVDALRDAGLNPIGAGVNRQRALAASRHSIKGVRVAVIAASQVIPSPSWIATDSSIGVAAAGKTLTDEDTRALTQAIASAKADADVVVVYMHWGQERAVCPTELQRKTADVLHKAGASIVVGAHPHVLQPIVRNGNDITAYSVGNFIWDPRSGITGDTGILELRFVGATVSDVVFHPHRLDGNGWAAPVSGADQNRIEGQIERSCVGADGTGTLTK